MESYEGAPLPNAQRENVEALHQIAAEQRELVARLRDLEERRHEAVMRIFGECAADPAAYVHVTRERDGDAEQHDRMTPEMVDRLRTQYEEAWAGRAPLRISGPGCDSFPACDDKENCVCVFSVGKLCCYACLSIAVIQCEF